MFYLCFGLEDCATAIRPLVSWLTRQRSSGRDVVAPCPTLTNRSSMWTANLSPSFSSSKSASIATAPNGDFACLQTFTLYSRSRMSALDPGPRTKPACPEHETFPTSGISNSSSASFFAFWSRPNQSGKGRFNSTARASIFCADSPGTLAHPRMRCLSNSSAPSKNASATRSLILTPGGLGKQISIQRHCWPFYWTWPTELTRIRPWLLRSNPS